MTYKILKGAVRYLLTSSDTDRETTLSMSDALGSATGGLIVKCLWVWFWFSREKGITDKPSFCFCTGIFHSGTEEMDQ